MTIKDTNKISLIIPAKNEASSLEVLLPEIKKWYPSFEVIVINDGSTDNTAEMAKRYEVVLINHPYSMGNGACIKTGARAANGDILVFMDGDGQHQVQDISLLLEKYMTGFDMVVGARERHGQASLFRWIGNSVYNFLASKIVNEKILDLTSGFRVVNAQKFKEFLYLLPNGFSYPTTITMAFFRSAYSVTYVPIMVKHRMGQSHLHPLYDGLRFFLIIYKMATLYSPLKIFVPLAMLHFLVGISNYAYTYATTGRFTNMSGVLLCASVIIFMMGLISEQITTLIYAQTNRSE